jgi:hypothetical protein
VDAIIEGTIRREGDRVRITAQLIDAREDRHLWADRYERNLENALSLQNEVALSIARAIRGRVTPDEQVRLARQSSSDAGAYDAYLRGRYELGKFKSPATDAALKHFERATERDETLALAYAGMSTALLNKTLFGSRPRETMPRAKEAALRALALDDELAEAHAALAAVHFYYDWDWDAAEAEFNRALSSGAGDPLIVNPPYACFLAVLGREAEAIEMIESAIARAPLDTLPRVWSVATFEYLGLHERALAEATQLIEIDPIHPSGYQLTAIIQEFLGNIEAAVSARVSASELGGRHAFATGLRAAFESGGATGYFEHLTSVGTGIEHQFGYFPNWILAAASAYLGRPDEAFSYLDRAREEREIYLVGLRRAAYFPKSLRSDPRYAELIRRIGLPD